MKKDLTLDDLKNIIRKYGFYVSEIEPMGPVHVLFLELFEKIYLSDKEGLTKDVSEDHKFEKYIIEYQSMTFEDIEEFENNIKEMNQDLLSGKENMKIPIFSFYSLNKEENLYRVRLAWLSNYFGELREITRERAKEILNTRRENVSVEFYQDLKCVYNL